MLRDKVPVGKKVAIIGAGGIGFDVAEFLAESGDSTTLDLAAWRREWGITDPAEARGGLVPEGALHEPPAREIILLQRKATKPGKGLGKTTGWIHRAALAHKNVTMRGGIDYQSIDDSGLHVTIGDSPETVETIKADNVIICAGQLSERELADALRERGVNAHVIGGSDKALDLDAKHAIDQGARLASIL